MKANTQLWNSRAGRRVFKTFLACSILPLILQAFLTKHWVEKQLISSAKERLYKASRGAQMTLVENVQNAERSLLLISEGIEKTGKLPRQLSEHARGYFSGLALARAGGGLDEQLGEAFEPPKLSQDQLAFLATGKSQLCITYHAGAERRIYLARQMLAVDQADQILFAQILPSLFVGLPTAEAEVIVADEAGRTIFSTLPEGKLSMRLGRVLADEEHGDELRWDLEGETFLGSCKLVFLAPQFHTNWKVLYSQSEAKILTPVSDFKLVFVLVLTLTFWIVTFASMRQIQKVLHPLAELRAGTQRIAKYDFSQDVEVTTDDEFQELAQSFNSMGGRLNRHMAIDRELHAIGMRLGRENDSDRVVELVLNRVLSLLKSDSSCMFLSKPGESLRLERAQVAHMDSQLNLTCKTEDKQQEFSSSPPRSLAAHCMSQTSTLRIDDWQQQPALNLEEEAVLQGSYGLRRKSIMAVPLKDHDGDLIGVLEVGRSGSQEYSSPFNEEDEQLFEAIGAQTALALSKNKLISGFREMMMSMTEVFAMAVDEKSPYTGAHCRRVPELTMMLAESARKSTRGSLSEYVPTDEEFFELKVAALLHDCGKVITPVHVMDKATKLESIHDRIGLVDLRFEILKRDEHIALLKERLGIAQQQAPQEDLEEVLAARSAELYADLEFLRYSNIGSERMPEEDRERVAAIGSKYSYQLMSGEVVSLLDEDELENLMVPWGTLTTSERKTINDHIVFTIRMLESLHYPKGLEQVPILAGTHHERMDGKGYPYGLTREEIPLGGRIMGIADVFEALTDADRPYKKGKTLQEALEILGKMTDTGHLDQELFELFMDDEIYLTYARKYLPPERMTPVDFSRIRAYVPPSERKPDTLQGPGRAA